MKITPFQILAGGVVAILGVIAFRAARAVGSAAQAINPLNNQNVVSEGFNELTGASDRGSSLGSDLFDFVQRLRGIPEFDPNAPPTTESEFRRRLLGGPSPIQFTPEVDQTARDLKSGPRIFVPPSFSPPIFRSPQPIQGSTGTGGGGGGGG